MPQLPEKITQDIEKAVSHYWTTRLNQKEKQKKRGVTDAGLRSAVTGGAQMDGFINLFTKLIIEAGFGEEYIFYKKTWNFLAFFDPLKNGIY
jgi:hypothetical protein